MLKKIRWDRVLIALAWMVSLGGVITLMSFIDGKKSAVQCRELRIRIPGMENFIGSDEVNDIVLRTSGPLPGRKLHDIDIQRLEDALERNPYIETASVYMDMDGVVKISVRQREPLLRLFSFTNQDFYIDRKGLKIPASANYTPHVIVASGFITESYAGKVDTIRTDIVRSLFKIAGFVGQDSLWKEQIEQLYVNEQNEIELIPRVGDHRIIFGSADSLEVKFRNLLAFYKKALPKVGWDAYKTINVKHVNQVICVKNNRDSLAVVPPAVPVVRDTITTSTQDTIKQ
jgi:cell division protein FtsQ